MNVEKLREVGQKLGYEGEELNEFVEEQLAYQLEEECLEAEEREAQRLHEEAQRLHEERMKQLEQKLRDLEAWEKLQDQEGMEQSHMDDVMEEIPEQGIRYPLDDDAAEEGSSKVEQVLMGLGAMEQPQKQDGIGQSHMEGYPINEEQQSGVEECSGRPMWAESEDVLADKSQKAASAIQVLGLDKEIQAGNDKVPMMEIDIEGQKAMALKDLARAIMGKFQVIFSDKPGRCKLVKHRKQLTSDVPVQSWPYTIPYTVRQELVRRLKLAGLAVRPSKCVIGAKTVQFLGHHVGDGMLG